MQYTAWCQPTIQKRTHTHQPKTLQEQPKQPTFRQVVAWYQAGPGGRYAKPIPAHTMPDFNVAALGKLSEVVVAEWWHGSSL